RLVNIGEPTYLSSRRLVVVRAVRRIKRKHRLDSLRLDPFGHDRLHPPFEPYKATLRVRELRELRGCWLTKDFGEPLCNLPRVASNDLWVGSKRDIHRVGGENLPIAVIDIPAPGRQDYF